MKNNQRRENGMVRGDNLAWATKGQKNEGRDVKHHQW